MLINSKNLFEEAKKRERAVIQFNVSSYSWIRCALESANECKSPIILGFTEATINYLGGVNVVYNIVKNLIIDLDIEIDVVLHLDKGSSFEVCHDCIDAGFTSIMVNGANLALDDNIKLVNEVIEYAYSRNVTVEASIGLIGKPYEKIDSNNYTKLGEVKKLVADTHVDSVAPSFGNGYGFYKKKPNFDYELLKNISDDTLVPLTFHGASDVDDKELTKVIKCGVAKLVFGTELEDDWVYEIRRFLKKNKEVYDPQEVLNSGDKVLKEIMKSKIKKFYND